MDRTSLSVEIGDCETTAQMGMVSERYRASADAGFYGFAAAMGRRKNICVDRTVSSNEQGLRIFDREQRSDGLFGDESINVATTITECPIRYCKSPTSGIKALSFSFLNSL